MFAINKMFQRFSREEKITYFLRTDFGFRNKTVLNKTKELLKSLEIISSEKSLISGAFPQKIQSLESFEVLNYIIQSFLLSKLLL